MPDSKDSYKTNLKIQKREKRKAMDKVSGLTINHGSRLETLALMGDLIVYMAINHKERIIYFQI